MKHALLIAPEFPPANTAGAHRPRLFAQHLAEFGWQPTVITVRADQIEGPLDPLLERLVDPAVRVIRTGALPVKPIRLTGDLGLRTLWTHARAARSLMRGERTDAIVLFGPPWFSYALGPALHREFGVPYVVDYIDPWMSDWTASHPFPSKGWFYHRAAAMIEPRVLRDAAHVTAVSDGILDDLRAHYPWLNAQAMSAMPYGAEPADLAASERLGVVPPDFRADDGHLTLCFTGAIQPKSAPLVDALLAGAVLVRQSGSEVGRRLRLRCYGTSNLTWGHDRFTVAPRARDCGLGDIVSEIPERVPYLQAMAVLHACDVVVVMGSTDAYYHASKLYPALVSGRPVLALCHADSSIAAVMHETAAGVCVTFRDAAEIPAKASEIARAIETLAQRRRGAGATNAAAVSRFTARASTAKLAAILDDVSRATPFAEAM